MARKSGCRDTMQVVSASASRRPSKVNGDTRLGSSSVQDPSLLADSTHIHGGASLSKQIFLETPPQKQLQVFQCVFRASQVCSEDCQSTVNFAKCLYFFLSKTFFISVGSKKTVFLRHKQNLKQDILTTKYMTFFQEGASQQKGLGVCWNCTKKGLER